jgi:DNA-binding XRE family transcriptional regulator
MYQSIPYTRAIHSREHLKTAFPIPTSNLQNRPLRVRFGERLRYLRQSNMYTQKQLAEYLGIDRSFISDVERGKKNLSLNFAETIAQGFRISLAELLKDV